jgi:predicted transposase YdaD
MAKTTDIGGKRLISLAPEEWIRWVTGRAEAQALEVLSGEFQWLSRATDALVRATLPQTGEFLVLIELQLRYSLRMPKRVRAYAALAEEKFDLPVYPVVVNVLPPGADAVIATAYDAEFMGLRARQDFRVINLWEVEAEEVWRGQLSALAPFAPVMRGGGDEATVRRALETLRADERMQEMEMLLAFFASFVLKTDLVQQIMRWDMNILTESPWYLEIEGKGEAKGEAKVLLRQLNKRFGVLDEGTQEQIRKLPLPHLEALADAVLDFKQPEDLALWLAGLNGVTQPIS